MVDAAVLLMPALRRLGEVVAAKREAGELPKGGRPAKNRDKNISVSLEDQGVDKHLADRSRTAWAMPEGEFEAGSSPLFSNC
jgi:hypothetical protein